MTFLPWQMTARKAVAQKSQTKKQTDTSHEVDRMKAAAERAAQGGKREPAPTTTEPRKPFSQHAGNRQEPSTPAARPTPTPVSQPIAPVLPTVERPIMRGSGFLDYGFVNPVPGAPPVTEFGKFGQPRTYRNGIHHGIDLNGAEGTNILSIQSGEVTFVGASNGAGGWKVEIDHGDGWVSKSYHIRDNGFLVQRGDIVAAGQPIALMGHTGQTSVTHLHIEIYKDGKPIDPEKLGVLNGDSTFTGETGDPFGLGQSAGGLGSGAQGIGSGMEQVAGTQSGPQKAFNPKDFQPLLSTLIDQMSLSVAGGVRSDINALRMPVAGEEEQLELIPTPSAGTSL